MRQEGERSPALSARDGMLHGMGDVALGRGNGVNPGEAEQSMCEKCGGEGTAGAVSAGGVDVGARKPVEAVAVVEQVCGLGQMAAGEDDVEIGMCGVQMTRAELHVLWSVAGDAGEGCGFGQVGCDGVGEGEEGAEGVDGVEQGCAGAGAEDGVEDDVQGAAGAGSGEIVCDDLCVGGAAEHPELDAKWRQVVLKALQGRAEQRGRDWLYLEDAEGGLNGEGGDCGRGEDAVGGEGEQVCGDTSTGGGVEAGDSERGGTVVGQAPSIAPYTEAMDARDRLIVALDVPRTAEALALVETLGEDVRWYKVGLELYLAEGAGVVRELKRRGKRVFLDLKLHDIPNTVASATRVAVQTGADLLTVHAAGGPEMLRAAVKAATGTSMALLAVTVLTSMDAGELAAAGVERKPDAQVKLLGEMALRAGVAGLVCSPLEVEGLRREHGAGPLLVVPGIRGAADVRGDQQRTASAGEAVRMGASMLVVGRPITRVANPAEVAGAMLREMAEALDSGADRVAGAL